MRYDGFEHNNAPRTFFGAVAGLLAAAAAGEVHILLAPRLPWHLPFDLLQNWSGWKTSVMNAGLWPSVVNAGHTALIAAIVAGSIVFATMPVQYRLKGGWRHVRGPRVALPPAGQGIARRVYRQMAARPGNQSKLLLAPKVPLPFESEVMGTLLIGAPAAGKSQILEWLYARWLERGDTRLIVLDAGKGDFISKWPCQEFILLAPHDDRVQPEGAGSQAMAWDIAADCTSFQDAAEFSERVVQESHEQHWSDGARLILQGILVGLQRTRGRSWGWADFHSAVIQSDADLNAWMSMHFPEALSYVALNPDGKTATKNANSYITNFRATVVKMTKPLALAWGSVPASRRISVRSWVLSGKNLPPTIILGRSGQFASMSAAWIGGLLRLINGVVNSPALSDNRNCRVMICLDELRTIAAKGDPLRQLVETGRSKGVGLVAAIQTVEQLAADDVYGQTGADAFLGVMQTKIIGKVMRTSSRSSGAAAFAELVGTQDVERWAPKAGGKDAPRTKEHKTQPVVLPNFFETALGAFNKCVRAALLLPEHLAIIEWPYSPWKPVRPAVVHARWIETIVSSLSSSEIDMLAADMPPDQQAKLAGPERQAVLRQALGIVDEPADSEEDLKPRPARRRGLIAMGVVGAIVVAVNIAISVVQATMPLDAGDDAIATAAAPLFDQQSGESLRLNLNSGTHVRIISKRGPWTVVDIPSHGGLFRAVVAVDHLKRPLPWE
jgi:hypothetical protein